MPNKEYYAKHAEKYKKMAMDYHLKNRKECLERMRKWKIDNKEEMKAYNKYHYWKNRPWHQQRWKEWAKGKHNANYERSKLPHNRWKSAQFHAKRRSLEWAIPLSEYLEYVKMRCHYCDGSLPIRGTGLDRLDNDKGYTIQNVVPCCGSCNKIRGNNLTQEEMVVAMKAVKELRLFKALKGVL